MCYHEFQIFYRPTSSLKPIRSRECIIHPLKNNCNVQLVSIWEIYLKLISADCVTIGMYLSIMLSLNLENCYMTLFKIRSLNYILDLVPFLHVLYFNVSLWISSKHPSRKQRWSWGTMI